MPAAGGNVDQPGRWGPAPDTAAEISTAIERLHDAALQRCYDPTLEAGVLGACLASASSYEAIRDFISADVFADPIHALIWEIYEDHYSRGLVADAITLRAPLAGRLMAPGKRAEQRLQDQTEWTDASKILAEILAALVSPRLAIGYARDLRDLWTRRNAAKKALELWRSSISDGPIEGDLAEAADVLDRLRTGPRETGGPVILHDAMRTALEATERAQATSGMVGVRSGFDKLDRMLRSFQAGRLYYLAGRPGMGKSALAQSMLRHGSAGDDGALVFALEMDEAMMGEREISMGSGADFEALSQGKASQSDWDAAVAEIGGAQHRRIWLDSRPRLSPADVVMTARRHLRRHPIKLIVIDHIHLMRPPKELIRANRTEQLEGISAALKQGAKELGVAMLILAQLSRDVDRREDKRPDLSDLRSSGALEQDADAVMFVYRPGYYTAQQQPPTVPADAAPDDPRYVDRAKWQAQMDREADMGELIVAKNRGGRTGTVGLTWHADRTLFTPWTAQQES